MLLIKKKCVLLNSGHVMPSYFLKKIDSKTQLTRHSYDYLNIYKMPRDKNLIKYHIYT